MKKEKTENKNKYLYASGRVRGLETTLLTPEKTLRLIEAPLPESYRILSECGYELAGSDVNASGASGIYEISRLLYREREKLYNLADKISQSPDISSFFKTRLDCHNIKTILKSDFLGTSADSLLLSGGVFDTEFLSETIKSGKYELLVANSGNYEPFIPKSDNYKPLTVNSGENKSSPPESDKNEPAVFYLGKYKSFPPKSRKYKSPGEIPPGKIWADAIKKAKEILSKTGDGQLADFVLDAAMLEICASHAQKSGSKFLKEYSLFVADTANLKTAVRLLRISNGINLAEFALSENGSIGKKNIIEAMQSGSLSKLYEKTPLHTAAKAGESAIMVQDNLSEFERELDRADREFFKDVKYIGFGPEILISFINAKEREYSTVRTIMSGKMAGLSPEDIKESLGFTK
jgi:V/A-type H+-transporting ATPase subunit C